MHLCKSENRNVIAICTLQYSFEKSVVVCGTYGIYPFILYAHCRQELEGNTIFGDRPESARFFFLKSTRTISRACSVRATPASDGILDRAGKDRDGRCT